MLDAIESWPPKGACHGERAECGWYDEVMFARVLSCFTATASRRQVNGLLASAILALAEASVGMSAEPEGWRSLFDGKTLGGWKSTPFGGEGEVKVEGGSIRLGMGADMTGITWSREFPKQHYEIELEARRIDGNDFFCGVTFPVGDDPCSLILGGWGGGVVGLSSIDGEDASRNATTQFQNFEKGRWYAVRIRVTPARIACDLDGKNIIDQPLEGHVVSIRGEVEASRPLGIATYATVGEVRGIRYRRLDAARASRDPAIPVAPVLDR